MLLDHQKKKLLMLTEFGVRTVFVNIHTNENIFFNRYAQTVKLLKCLQFTIVSKPEYKTNVCVCHLFTLYRDQREN